MNNQYVIGIDAGGTKVAYGLFTPDGKMIDRFQHSTDAAADGPAFTDRVIASINALLDKNGISINSLYSVGICMPSFVLFDQGKVLLTSAMPCIKNFAMRDYMEQRLNTRIVLDNDSNAAALAEYRHGAGRGCRHMVYVSAGTGLGSGIIIDGKLFRGSYGWAGECGHMIATPDEGVLCGCENRGCYMSYASGKYLPAQLKLRLDAGAESILKENAGGEEVLAAYNQGDKLAAEIVELMAHYYALCVFNVYQMLNIDTYVFGGGLLAFGDAFLGRMKSEFERYNHIPLPVYFKTAELKKDFGIIGAAEFVREA